MSPAPARGCRWQSPGPSRSYARRVGAPLCSIMFCPASRWVKLVRVFTPASLYNRRPSRCPSIIGDLEGLPGGQRRRLAWCRNLHAHGSVSVGWQPRALECGAEWTSPRIEYRACHHPLAGLVFRLGSTPQNLRAQLLTYHLASHLVRCGIFSVNIGLWGASERGGP